MRLTKMQRQVLRHFANEWERFERGKGGSETLRAQQVAGSLNKWTTSSASLNARLQTKSWIWPAGQVLPPLS